jgi:hypothetical protein
LSLEDRGGRPRGELSPFTTRPQQQAESQQGRPADSSLTPLIREPQSGEERSHEQLVEAFRNAIRRKQKEWEERGDYWSPAHIIQSELFHQAQFRYIRETGEYAEYKKLGEFYHPILNAWDVIAYDHYAQGPDKTGAEVRHIAGLSLSQHYQQTGQMVIRLSERQTRILDALAEAADIPHQKGQAAIEIPEKIRGYEGK